MLSDTYAYNRAGRMASAGSTSYTYNGLGHLVSESVSGTATKYVLDSQPGLVKILQADDGTDKFSYVTSRFGVLAREDNANGWLDFATDALGNVRQVLDGSVDASFEAQKVQDYMPYGETLNVTQVTPNPEGDIFGFTGELATENMLHLRARNYIPAIGVFPSLDPVEGCLSNSKALNRYGYVADNPINLVDPSGMTGEKPPSCGSDNLFGPRGCPAIIPSYADGSIATASFWSRVHERGRYGYPNPWGNLSTQCLMYDTQYSTSQPTAILVRPRNQTWDRGSAFSLNDPRFRGFYTIPAHSVFHIRGDAIYGLSVGLNRNSQNYFNWKIPRQDWYAPGSQFGANGPTSGRYCYLGSQVPRFSRATFKVGYGESEKELTLAAPTTQCEFLQTPTNVTFPESEPLLSLHLGRLKTESFMDLARTLDVYETRGDPCANVKITDVANIIIGLAGVGATVAGGGQVALGLGVISCAGTLLDEATKYLEEGRETEIEDALVPLILSCAGIPASQAASASIGALSAVATIVDACLAP